MISKRFYIILFLHFLLQKRQKREKNIGKLENKQTDKLSAKKKKKQSKKKARKKTTFLRNVELEIDTSASEPNDKTLFGAYILGFRSALHTYHCNYFGLDRKSVV